VKKLTTTSHAVLGLLGLQPWSTYELAKQMERSLRNFWPRAESKLYEEPKNLVAHGLARAREERVGNRPRTVYTITAKGRRALRSWLDEPGAGPLLEFEALLKVFFADQGTKEQLLANIRTIKHQAEEGDAQGRTFAREYLETGGPFPERLPVIGLMVRFLHGHNAAILEWARWAEAEVQNWADMSPPPDYTVFKRILERGGNDVAGD